MIIRDTIASSNLVSAGYDATSETLELEFQSGAVYQYYNVPPGVYEALRSAPSAGQFFAYQIKNQFPFSRTG
jgi:hypothetical protein